MADLTPYELMAALVLEDGTLWGSNAEPFQRVDAQAVLNRETVRRHFLLRGRGMSKTTDTAAMVLALLLVEAPARSRSHAYASDTDQAAILLDTIRGLAERSGMAGLLDFTNRTVTVKKSDASLTVESADGASAFGLRPWLTVVDELGVWPTTQNHRRLWSAIVSAVPKVPGSRLVVISTAGSPTGLGAEAWAAAEKSPNWRTSKNPGPAPWWDVDDMLEVGESLTRAEYNRLILCEWAEGDDALTSPEDVAAAIRSGVNALPPRPGIQYVAALDVGTRRDLTALTVGHIEHRDTGRTVVIDRVMYWRPKRDVRVDLTEVEAATLRLCKQYRVRRLRFDRMQAEQLTSNLTRAGINCEEFIFSAAGANRLARSLWGVLRDRALELPDDDETREEFLTTRMIETGPSVVKLQNPAGTHDDIVTAVGMVVADLMQQPDTGNGGITVPRRHVSPQRDTKSAREHLAAGSSFTPLSVRERARQMPRGLVAIKGVPGAHDDPRRTARH